MQKIRFKTNLRCDSCVQKIAVFLDPETSISSWEVDVSSPEKILSVSGSEVNVALIQALIAKAGYEATRLDSAVAPTSDVPETSQSYFPLILIFAYLSMGVLLVEIGSRELQFERLMSNFMGGFFVVFSFFKVLNLKGFADTYSTYDLIAKRFKTYAYVYPFIELGLGIGYWLHLSSLWLNVATVVVMGVSSLGVIQSLMNKRVIQCACLGTVFNLPMSVVTLVEDLLMVAMAGLMIVMNA